MTKPLPYSLQHASPGSGRVSKIHALFLTASLLAMTTYGSSQAPSPAAGAATADKSAPPASVVSKTATPASQPPVPLAVDLGPGMNVEDRSKDILAHLSSVIRYYRTAAAPTIQKVGEPSDALYRDQATSQAGQVADYAFESARAEALLLDAQRGKASGIAATTNSTPPQGEAQRLQVARQTVTARISDLKAKQVTLDEQIAHARPKDIAALTQQRTDVQGALELSNAMADALGKIVGMSDTQGRTGLTGDIDRLQRSAPELSASKGKTVVPPLASLDTERSSGVSSQAIVLFQLIGTRHDIEALIQASEDLHTDAMALRTPVTNILRSTLQTGNMLSQQVQDGLPTTDAVASAAPAVSAQQPVAAVSPADARKRFESVTATFKALSSAAVPLSEEIILLEQSRANLLAWRTAVNEEYRSVLHNVLLRVLSIAIALGIIFILGEVWKRATNRYVHDPRRRRQIMALRRLVVGFLSGLVLIFGFVTQFNSLTTFAGFITAGLAVGLQTILLSVAAYFFIIGRYGVRVGDRISVAGVSGDVIDVGLVRFYIMELAGSETDLHPTGRVAVFSNSVLFQAGTPLYKQMPGTEYAWHELTVKLALTADYAGASDAMLKAVKATYETYRAQIEAQHKQMETWMDTAVDAPAIDSRMQLVTGGLQLAVRFPVEIRNASQVDQEITQSVLGLMTKDERVKAAVIDTPAITSAVKK